MVLCMGENTLDEDHTLGGGGGGGGGGGASFKVYTTSDCSLRLMLASIHDILMFWQLTFWELTASLGC